MRWSVARSTTILYGVELSVAADRAIQAVDPFGRWARRTSRYPLSCSRTGKADGAPYHVAGTVPVCGPPGVAKSGAVSVNVATSDEGSPFLYTILVFLRADSGA